MPTIKYEGLKGLPGVKPYMSLSEFYQKYKDRLAPYSSNEIQILYDNQKFVHDFGREAFDSLPSHELRMQAVNDYEKKTAFEKRHNSGGSSNKNVTTTTSGMDIDSFNFFMSNDPKYIDMLDELGYKAPAELKSKERADDSEYGDKLLNTLSTRGITGLAGTKFAHTITTGIFKSLNNIDEEDQEAKIAKVKNAYYEDEANKQSERIEKIREAKYDNAKSEDVKNLFKEAVTPGINNLGNRYYSAYYGNGTDKGKDSMKAEMQDFGIEDMKDYLAKRDALKEAGWSESTITEYLEGEAQNYIRENQGFVKRKLLQGKDIAINTTTYFAQKNVVPFAKAASGVRDVRDPLLRQFGIEGFEQPQVFSDAETGQILSQDRIAAQVDQKGNFLGYKDKKTGRTAILTNISHSEAFDQGVDTSGESLSKPTSFNKALNDWGVPTLSQLQDVDYLEKSSMYNTFDKEEQERADNNYGVSPYRPAYAVGESEDIAMSIARMGSFMIEDGTELALTTLLTGGAGTEFKAAQIAANASKWARVGSMFKNIGGTMGKFAAITAPYRGATGIGIAYGKGNHDETLQNSMSDLAKANKSLAQQNTLNWMNENPEDFNREVRKEYDRLKALDKQRVASAVEGQQRYETPDETLIEMAESNVIGKHAESEYNNILNSDTHKANVEAAQKSALMSELVSTTTEALKYAAINKFSYRQFLYKTPQELAKAIAEGNVAGVKAVFKNGVEQLVKDPVNKLNRLGKFTWDQIWGGAYTNFTDDMQSWLAKGAAETWYHNYLLSQANGEAYNEFNSIHQWETNNVINGALESMWGSLAKGTTWHAGFVGAAGSLFIPIPNVVNMATMGYHNAAWRIQAYMHHKKGGLTDAEYQKLLDNNPYKILNKKLVSKDATDRLAEGLHPYFTHGLLNNYVAALQSDAVMQAQIDALNKASSNNFGIGEVIKAMVGTGGRISGPLDAKDSKFIQAMYTLQAMKKNQEQAESVEGAQVQLLLDKFSSYNTLMDAVEAFEETGEISPELQKVLLAEYYASNHDKAQSEAQDREAMNQITEYMHELHKADVAYKKAIEEIEETEKTNGPINPFVKEEVAMYKALYESNKKRTGTMQKELTGSEELVDEEGSVEDLIYLFSHGDSQGSLNDHLKAISAAKESIAGRQKDIQLRIQYLQEQLNNVEQITPLTAPEKAREISNKSNDLRLQIEDLQETYNRLDMDLMKYNRQESMLSEAVKNSTNPDEGGKYILTIKQVLGDVNPTNTKSLDDAIEKIKKLPWQTRARLIKNIEAEIARRSAPELKGNALYDDINFPILKAIYDHFKKYDPDSLEKIKDIATLKVRTDAIEREMDLGLYSPEIALHRFQKAQMFEQEKAIALWDRRIAQSLVLKAERELGNVDFNKVKYLNRSKNYKKAYNNLFNYYINVSERALKQALELTDNQAIKDILQNALDYSTTMGDIIESARSLNPDLTSIEANALSATLNSMVDAYLPTRDDLLYALQTLAETNNHYTFDLNAVYDNLKILDDLRNSNVVRSAEERNSLDKVRKEHKRLREEREARVKEQAEKEAREKAEKEQKKKEELQGKPATDNSVTPGPQGHPTGENIVDNGKQGDAAHMTGQGDQVDLYNDPNDNPLNAPDFEAQAAEVNASTHKDGEPDKVAALSGQTVIGEDAAPTQVEIENLLIGHLRQEYDPTEIRVSNVRRLQNPPSPKWTAVWNFLDREGVKLSNIIDHELGRILKKNPDTKIKFMTVHPGPNRNPSALSSQIFNVIEVTPDVERIHNPDNGGIIKAQDGKNYLIVGTLGYSNAYAGMQNSYNTMASQFFADRKATDLSNADYYVNERFSSKVAKMFGGNKVTSLNGEGQQVRSITELIADPTRNPYGLELGDIKWLIQTMDPDKPMIINPGLDNTFCKIKDIPSNLGNVFAYIPSSNGAYIPIQVAPRTLNEIPEGRLKNTIIKAIQALNSLDWAERKKAASVLDKLIFYNTDEVTRRNVNSKQGKMLWVGSENNPVIRLMDGNMEFRSFTLTDPNFSLQALVDAIFEHNPRIQITPGTLASTDTIEMYAEAGCLNMNIASLATYNASYFIGSMNADGTMKIPSHNNTIEEDTNKGFSSYYNGVRYRLVDGKWLTEIGEPVTNPNLIYQLEMNYKIKFQNLEDITDPNVKDRRPNELYIISDDINNPIIVSRNKDNYEVSAPISKDQALRLLKEYKHRKSMEQQFEESKKAAEQVNLGTQIDANTGQAVIADNVDSNESKADANNSAQQAAVEDNIGTNQPIKNSPPTPPTPSNTKVSAVDVYNNPSTFTKFTDLVLEKYEELNDESSIEDIVSVLEKHNIATTDIEDVDAWLDNIKNCK